MHTGVESPRGVWWKPAHKAEKVWVVLAFAWCMVLFAMMPLWHWKGGQNPSGIRARVDPADYVSRADGAVRRRPTRSAREENGIPIVEPPPGGEVYLDRGQMWLSGRPRCRLQKDAEYTLHLSSLDVNHGFNALPVQRQLPGRAGLRLRPAGHAHGSGRLPDRLQRVLRRRPPRHGGVARRPRPSTRPPKPPTRDEDEDEGDR